MVSWVRALGLGLAVAASSGTAFEPADKMATAEEGFPVSPPGPWQGDWVIRREDPRIRTLGGSELFRLQIVHDTEQNEVSVAWQAGRAICEDPLAPPCEWVGETGAVSTRPDDELRLDFTLLIGADQQAFHLALPHPSTPAASPVLTHADLRYILSLESVPLP